MNPARPIAPKAPTANADPERPVLPPASPPTIPLATAKTEPRRRPTAPTNLGFPLHRARALALVAVAVAVGLILGSAWLRLPPARQASARIAKATGLPTLPPAPPVDPTTLAKLRAAAHQTGDRLVRNRAEFRELLTDLERQALACGWQIETQVQPAPPAPEGLPELITYAVTATLVATPNHPGPAFDGLLLWLDGLSRSPKAVEIASVLLLGDANGLSKARVDLRLIGRANHEPHPPK